MNKYDIFAFITVFIIGGFIGSFISYSDWKFWVLLLVVVSYGIFNKLSGNKDALEEGAE